MNKYKEIILLSLVCLFGIFMDHRDGVNAGYIKLN